ncbi:MAG: hypothetical protein R3Y64_09060 [Peptostreptococcaceae bacterium]
MKNSNKSTLDKVTMTEEKIELKNEEIFFGYITPGKIMSSPELTFKEKILYSQLFTLAQGKEDRSTCITDEHLRIINHVCTKSAVQKWLKGLRDKGYIVSKLDYEDETKSTKVRKIFLTDKFK